TSTSGKKTSPRTRARASASSRTTRRASPRSRACSAASRSPRAPSRTRASCSTVREKGPERDSMRRWRIDAAPAAADLDEIAALLRGGGVVLLPTDTIYGLHALATDEKAIARLANIKGRDDGKPFVVIGASIDQLIATGIDVMPELRTQ